VGIVEELVKIWPNEVCDKVQNRRRVVYYTILLIIILEELLGEINYIIVRFPEYNSSRRSRRRVQRMFYNKEHSSIVKKEYLKKQICLSWDRVIGK